RTTIEAIEAWLFGDAMDEDDLLPLFEAFAWRMVAAGLPLERASLHVGTLHPQLIAFAWVWNRGDGLCDEVKVAEAALKADSYKRNPLSGVIERGETFRGNTRDPAMAARFPLLADLAQQGIAEDLALPLRAGGTYHNAATVATGQEGGFTEAQRADLGRL